MSGPLEDVRVVELTTMITGPVCGQMLADLGAQVIKVENPDGGDPFRRARGGLYSAPFGAYNRNKRSVTVNLRTDEGREVLLRLVERADVLVENYRPGVMDRLKLGQDVLGACNPRLIHCSITGFGPDGPYRDRPAYDAVAQSVAGLSSLFVDPEEPQITGPAMSDNLAGMNACYGILAALYGRAQTGAARRVEISMMEATMGFIGDRFAYLIQDGTEQNPLSRVRGSQSYALRCADGKLLAIHMSSPEKNWRGTLAALGCDGLADDQRFATHQARIGNYLELKAEFLKAAATAPRQHFLERLAANDVPHAPVHTIAEVLDDPQVKHLDSFFKTTHPSEGELTLLRRPVRFDGARDDQPLNPPPTLGEHTDAVLGELGYDAEAVARLRAEGIV